MNSHTSHQHTHHAHTRLGDLSLLRTMTSPVAGFEEQAEEFVRYLRGVGVGVEEALG